MSRKEYITIAIVLLGGLLLRITSLGQSLWLDEATSANVALHTQAYDIVTVFSPTDFHPPGYYLVLRLWTILWGGGVIALRSLSVIASLVAALGIYAIVRRISQHTAALYSMAFFLANPLSVYYAQEARMYMLVVALLTWYTYGLIAYEKDRKGWQACLIVVTSSLALCTYYGSGFYIAASWIALLHDRRYKTCVVSIIGPIISLLTLLTLIIMQMDHARAMLSLVPEWRQVLGSASIKNLLLIPVKFATGRISFEPKHVYISLAIATCLTWVYPLQHTIERKDRTWWILMLVPITIGAILSVFTPMLQYFRFIYILIPLSILIGRGLAKSPSIIAILISVILLTWSSAYVGNPTFHREDWQSLAAGLRTNDVYMIYSSSDPLQYYSQATKIHHLTLDQMMTSALPDTLMVIPYTADIHGVDYRHTLLQRGYELGVVMTYRGGLSVEEWKQKKSTE